MTKKILFSVICISTTLFSISQAKINNIIEYHFYHTTNNLSIDNKNTPWESIISADNFLKQNLISLLESDNRQENLETYLNEGTNLLDSFSHYKNTLSNEIHQTENNIKICQSQLNSANQLFTMSIKSKSESGFYQAIENAKSARSCIGENQAHLSGLSNLLNIINRYSSQLEGRVSYLKNNQDLIINHYSILKPKLLSELYHIAVQLENRSSSL